MAKANIKAAELKQLVKATVATFTAKEKEHAAIIIGKVDAVDAAQAGLFGSVNAAIRDGAQWAGLEAAEPRLKDCGAYRSAKNAIKGALEAGVPLVNSDGTPKSRNALKDETAKKQGKVAAPAGGRGARHTAGPKDEAKAIKVALDAIVASAKLRKLHAVQLLAIADMVRTEAQAPKVKKAA